MRPALAAGVARADISHEIWAKRKRAAYTRRRRQISANQPPATSATAAAAASPTRNDCTDYSGAYTIEMIRSDGVYDCTRYELTVTNNAP